MDFRKINKWFSKSNDKITAVMELSKFLTIVEIEISKLVSGLKHNGTFFDVSNSIETYLKHVKNVIVERNNFFHLRKNIVSLYRNT